MNIGNTGKILGLALLAGGVYAAYKMYGSRRRSTGAKVQNVRKESWDYCTPCNSPLLRDRKL